MSYSVVHALYQLPDGRAFAEHTDLYDADDLQKFAAKRGCSASQLAPDGGLLCAGPRACDGASGRGAGGEARVRGARRGRENELVALAGRLCSPLNKTEADCFVLSKARADPRRTRPRAPPAG